ncbi:hypothetical protein BLOT_002814 [Blomia tropicalis]|nr:hypothetical protein BLOT_002814 [Blomia tropicalis]
MYIKCSPIICTQYKGTGSPSSSKCSVQVQCSNGSRLTTQQILDNTISRFNKGNNDTIFHQVIDHNLFCMTPNKQSEEMYQIKCDLF